MPTLCLTSFLASPAPNHVAITFELEARELDRECRLRLQATHDKYDLDTPVANLIVESVPPHKHGDLWWGVAYDALKEIAQDAYHAAFGPTASFRADAERGDWGHYRGDPIPVGVSPVGAGYRGMPRMSWSW